jgi:hypothetical protein
MEMDSQVIRSRINAKSLWFSKRVDYNQLQTGADLKRTPGHASLTRVSVVVLLRVTPPRRWRYPFGEVAGV